MSALAAALADAITLLHLAFVGFVVFGGMLVVRLPGLARFHLPALAWGICIEAAGWVCPLTYAENALRRMAGEGGYTGGFVETYVLSILYPEGLTRGIQLSLAAGLLLLNILVYARLAPHGLVGRMLFR